MKKVSGLSAILLDDDCSEGGLKVQEDDIERHRKDVIRLTATLAGYAKVEAPEVIKRDCENTLILQGIRIQISSR